MKKSAGKNDLRTFIRDIPDFPKPGIMFKDITPLLKDPAAFKRAIDALAKKYKTTKIDKIVAVESRGFIFATILAYKLGVGFIPVRKRGKLPYKTRGVTYALEYGSDTLEMHEDALRPGEKVLIVDDLLATGGTVDAVVKLVQGAGAKIVGIAFAIELKFLKGRERLKDFPMYTVIEF